jgi:(3S)-malyl-CoA thioesterase
MGYSDRPFRSVLYIPGSNTRAMEKAKTLNADALIFDLEDAVTPDEKAMARTAIATAIRNGGYGKRSLIVRVNGLDTPWGVDDVNEISQAGPEAILLPKVGSPSHISKLAGLLEHHPAVQHTRIWAMMETPEGISNADEIAAASPRMRGFVMGTNDLASELNTRFREDRLPLQTSLCLCVLAARRQRMVCIDGVYNAFKDVVGLRREADQGRDLGFDGKSLIHPSQVPVSNEVFMPTQTDIDLYQRQIAAFELAEAEGRGVAVLDGRIVENLHVATARKNLAKIGAINELEAC